jgi:hypothetical protein
MEVQNLSTKNFFATEFQVCTQVEENADEICTQIGENASEVCTRIEDNAEEAQEFLHLSKQSQRIFWLPAHAREGFQARRLQHLPPNSVLLQHHILLLQPVIVVQVAVSYSVLQCPVEGQYLLHPHQPEVWRELRKASSQFLFLEEVEARGERMPVEAIPQLLVVMVFHVEEHPALQRVVASCDAPLSSVASLSSSAPTQLVQPWMTMKQLQKRVLTRL